MKKEKIKNNTIVICLIIIICLLLLLISLVLIKGKVKYKYYDDELIEINNKTKFEVKANILYNTTLAVLVKSNEKKPCIASVVVKMYNESGKQVLKDDFSDILFNDNSNVFTFALPVLDKEEYAGKIEVEVNKENISYSSTVDIDKVKYSINKKENEDNSLAVDVNFTNNNTENLSLLSGYIVAFKDNDIVDIQYFSHENVLVGSTVTSNVTFISNAGLESFDYDKIDVYITHIDGNLQ